MLLMDDSFLDFSTIGHNVLFCLTSQCGRGGQGLEGPRSSHNCKKKKRTWKITSTSLVCIHHQPPTLTCPLSVFALKLWNLLTLSAISGGKTLVQQFPATLPIYSWKYSTVHQCDFQLDVRFSSRAGYFSQKYHSPKASKGKGFALACSHKCEPGRSLTLLKTALLSRWKCDSSVSVL